MRLKAPSLAWLVAHDLRMSWRMLGDMFQSWTWLATALAIGSGLGCLHLIAGFLVLLHMKSPGTIGPGSLVTASAGVLFWMIAQGLLGATRALYERGHLEVLFSSPLPAWKAVVSRALAIMAASLVSVGLLTMPMANAGAIIAGRGWLLIYPVEIALALLGTAAGFLIAIGLFHAAGPRRARQISQVLAAGIAGAFILGVQIAAILPAATRDWLIATAHQARAGVSSLGGPALDWMAGALMQGDAAAIATFLALSAAVFAAAVIALSGAFSQASQLAAGAAGSAQVTASRPYREGVAPSLRRKEWRLLLRDPNLFAQLSLQIIYTLPVVVFLLRGSNDIAPALALAPFIVVLATQISASLAWLTVSGEDAPELIQSAPVGGFEASMAKLTAIGAPVALILAAPLIALFALSPQAAVYTALCSGLAGCSAALLNFWHPMAGNRRGLLRRHSQSKIVALAEHGLAILWALAVVFAMVDWRVVAIPALGILLILWLFKPQPVRLPFLRGRRPVAVVQM